METIIIYGTTTGNAENTAISIGNKFEDSTVEDVAGFNLEEISNYDLVILGTSTGGFGEVQDDWEEKLDQLGEIDLKGKTVALFGTGDQEGYSDSFASSINYLYEKVENSGAKIVGWTSIEGYNFAESDSVRGDKFIGLVIDDDNQPQLTDDRIKKWAEQIKTETN